MKVLVATKRVVDPNVRVSIRPDGSGFDTSGLKTCLNPFDEVAVEQAVRLKEAGVATEVVVASIGPAVTKDTLRSALALGADRGVLVECAQPEIETLAVARVLAALVQREAPALVLLGKQSVDNDAAQCGPMLAGLLGWPQATFASQIEVGADHLRALCDAEDGVVQLELALPCVVTADLRLAEPRYATLQNVMAARRKPIATLAVDSLVQANVLQARLRLRAVQAVDTRRSVRMVDNPTELAERLREVLA